MGALSFVPSVGANGTKTKMDSNTCRADSSRPEAGGESPRQFLTENPEYAPIAAIEEDNALLISASVRLDVDVVSCERRVRSLRWDGDNVWPVLWKAGG